MTRKNIKLKEDLFERLKADKPDTMSWPRYFEEQCLGDSEPETTDDSGVDLELKKELAKIRQELGETREAAVEATSAAQSAKRGVEELGGQR